MTASTIPFIDLESQRRRLNGRIEQAIARVIDSGRFILGEEVQRCEAALAEFGGARHAIGCANGTDALALVLMAWGIGPGDAVFVPSFTFTATSEAVARLGATPVFVDIDPATYTMDPAALGVQIAALEADASLRARVIIAVDLFGQPADYPRLAEIARAHDLKLLADSAQAFGCTLNGHQPLHWADATTTSFFPAKPLGCYGDGGAVLTQSDGDAACIRSLAQHGQGATRYSHVRIGLNSRLDAIQAAILTEKLSVFRDEIIERGNVAQRYAQGLAAYVHLPQVIAGGVSTWAQFTIAHADRDGLAAALHQEGVPTAIYYATPTHLQPAYASYRRASESLLVTEAAARGVLSLPMSAYVSAAVQDRIAKAIARFSARPCRAAA